VAEGWTLEMRGQVRGKEQDEGSFTGWDMDRGSWNGGTRRFVSFA